MKAQNVSYASVNGVLFCQFFGCWMKSAFNQPEALSAKPLQHCCAGMAQPVFGEIQCSNAELAS